MAGYIFGIGFIAFALWRLSRNQLPEGGSALAGTVTGEIAQESTQTGRRDMFYGPEASYVHPTSGEAMTYRATRFGGDRYTVGDTIDLLFDPLSGEVTHKLASPAKNTFVLLAVGVGLIAAQYFGG